MGARVALAFVALSIVASAPAGATVIASESFNYTSGVTVDGQNGGTGWASAWVTGQTTLFTTAAAISGAPDIGQTGGALAISGSGRAFRAIDVSAGSAAAAAGLVATHTAMFFGSIDGIGAPGTTVWIGILISGGSGNAGAETQYHLYDGAYTDPTNLGHGDSNKDGEVIAMLRGGSVADWGFERTCNWSSCGGAGGDGYFATNPVVAFGGTHWAVMRLDFHSTTTDVTVWRDPTPGTTPPSGPGALALTPFSGGSAVTTTTVPALFFNTFTPNAGGNYNYVVDEIRIGTTFADLSGGVVGPSPDAGVIDASVPGIDGAPGVPDGGGNGAGPDAAPGAESPAGCGCRTGARTPSAVLAALVLLVLVRRRR